ncbi:MAG: YheC/YheD family protein [Thermaerobacter sp.]|nr:hypothetical protein [Bacillota bacterium]REJ38432.1 MAG: hypothetical protein DIU84_00065 [Bacillota bacterium]
MPPVRVGILAFVHRNPRRPFGEQTGYIRGLLLAGRRLGLSVYAFGPQNVAADGRIRHAYMLGPGGRGWRTGPRGRPDIVYDRFFLHLPQADTLRRYRALRRRPPFRFLNPSLPDKWQVYRRLLRDRSLRDLLPPTAPYRDPAQLARRLARWGSLVIKPRAGMKGRGLWFVSPTRDGLVIRSSTGGARRLPRGGLAGWARAHLRGRLLLQPELHLRDGRGRPFDLRVLVQRDGRGHLAVTGSAVRVGRAGTRVANLHRGGTAMTLEDAQARLPGLAAAAAQLPGGSLAAAAHDAALRVTAALERRWGRFAELGIDLGFDLRRGRLFFLEANTRPGRMVFRISGNHRSRVLSIQRPLEYARYVVRGRKDGEAGG